MDIVLIVLGALLLLGVLYVLSLRGRTGHPGLEPLKGWAYAHRGLHGPGIPENSMAAFRAALENGYGIEFDVHLLADGGLAVIHDASLKRTAGVSRNIEELTTWELQNYRLEGTEETIPQFQQVLELYRGKAPLVIELKSVKNAAALCEAVCKALEDYEGVYCLESFDPRCVHWLKKHRPELIRGQLSENFLRVKSRTPLIARFLMAFQIPNFLTRPDFIAYKYIHKNHVSVKLCRKLWKLQGVSWTLRSQEEFDDAVQQGWIPIFEGFEP